MSSMDHLIDQYFEEHFAEGVKDPAKVSEDDAIRSVQEQFDDAGFDCSEQTARGLVHEAWRRAAESATRACRESHDPVPCVSPVIHWRDGIGDCARPSK